MLLHSAVIKYSRIFVNEDSIIKKHFQNKSIKWSSMDYMKMGPLQNIQLFETCIETGNLQSYDRV